MSSLYLNEGESFFSTPISTLLTILSFSVKFLLIFYFYLVTYQLLLFTVVIARSFKWCLDHLNSACNSPDFSLIQSKVRKYEHLRSLMTEYNEIFSGLLLICKFGITAQLVIMSYLILARMNMIPKTSLLICATIVIYYSVLITILLTEMGSVLTGSKEFKNNMERSLVKGDLKPGQMGMSSEDLRKAYLTSRLLSGCGSFGFRCGSCYVIGRGTILTFFPIVTSYLIIMMQMQI